MAEEHWVMRAQERVGKVLRQKWRLDRLLGVGGMAAVYAATHRNGKRAAVKVLHAEHALNPDLRTRFLREGYVANTVDHSGTVSVLDDDTDDEGCVYLVMELLEGETLEARWERKHNRLDPGEVLSITDKLLDVLAAAHDRHIVHRDIKPENVFLTRNGVVKVLDFGIARLLEMSQYSSRTTRAGSAMGTPAFMPPEQAAGDWDAVDERTDLWAVGAVMFTLISGRFVHEGRNLNEQLIASATKPAPSLGVAAPFCSPAVVGFVDKALAFRKSERWPDARLMQVALREAYWAKDQAERRASKAELYPPVDRLISIHVPAANVAALEKAALAAPPRRPALPAAPLEEQDSALSRSAAALVHDHDGPPTDERMRASGSSDALTDPEATVYEPRGPLVPMTAPPPPGDDDDDDDHPTQALVGVLDPTVPVELRGSQRHAIQKRMQVMNREAAGSVHTSARAVAGLEGTLGRSSGRHSASGTGSSPENTPTGQRRPVPPAYAGGQQGTGSSPSAARLAATGPSMHDDSDEENVAVFRLERPLGEMQRQSGVPIDVKQIRLLASKGGRTMDGISTSAHPVAVLRSRWKFLAALAAASLLGFVGLLVATMGQSGTRTAAAGAAQEPSVLGASSSLPDAGAAEIRRPAQ